MRRNIYRYYKVTECLFESEQGDYGAGRWSVDQIFTLKQISEKARGLCVRDVIGACVGIKIFGMCFGRIRLDPK